MPTSRKLLIGWLMVAACLGEPWPATAAEPADCGLKRYASLPLQVDADAAVAVPAMINGTPGYFRLDLSTPFTRLRRDAVEQLHLKSLPLRVNVEVLSGGLPMDHYAVVNELRLGDAIKFPAELLIDPHPIDPASPPGPLWFGDLAMDVLGKMDVELDIAHRVMNLYAHFECKASPVYWAHDYGEAPLSVGEAGELYFPMKLNGKKIEATLGAGPASAVYTDVTRRLFDFDETAADVEHTSDPSGAEGSMFIAMALSTDELTVTNARVQLVKRRKESECRLTMRNGAAAYVGCYGVHPLKLGRYVVAKLHLYIAPKRKVLYFTSADAGP